MQHVARVLASPLAGVYSTHIDSAQQFDRHWHDTYGFGFLEHGAQEWFSGRGIVRGFSMQGSAISIVRQNPMACSATPSSRAWQQRQRIYLGRAPMAVTSKRERVLQVALVVLGLGTAVANIYPLVTSLLALRPTGGTTAPMFYTILATLGVFLVLAARNPSAHRSLIAYTVCSSLAHGAVMALMALQLPTKHG